MFSIAILTRNEEQDIAACLASVAFANDVLVFDSFSTDATVERALALGVRVMQHAFTDYASQRMACLTLGEFRHEWVFMLDADERFTPALQAEIERELQRSDNPHSLYRLRRKDHFKGVWIRGAGGYPTWFGRLLRRGQVRITRPINELYETDGGIGFLQEHLIHLPFSKGLERWLARHNDYSTAEAAALFVARAEPIAWRDLLHTDPAARRRALKGIYYRLPLRPWWVFVYLYLWRGGFLEGRSGYYYACLRMSYEIMIDTKSWLDQKPSA
ncbi:MAG: glycosyltransferase family 2 protein [Pseudomonadota bacterium]